MAPPALAPLRPLALARTRYVSDVTPRYLQALHSVRADARELPTIAGAVRRWCAALTEASPTPQTPVTDAELRAACAGAELKEGAVEHILTDFEAAASKESGERSRAREAAMAAIAHPDDAKAVADGVRALDEARLAAVSVVGAAHALRESSAALARDVGALRIALRSLDTLRPGVPTYLSTYGTSGNAELEVDASPVDAVTAGTDLEHRSMGKATARFPVVGRHYLDVEAGVGWKSGAAAVPYVSTIQGKQVIQTSSIDGFVGLALVELEPLRFAWPDRPAAGALRFPVVGIPFTKDPDGQLLHRGRPGLDGHRLGERGAVPRARGHAAQRLLGRAGAPQRRPVQRGDGVGHARRVLPLRERGSPGAVSSLRPHPLAHARRGHGQREMIRAPQG